MDASATEEVPNMSALRVLSKALQALSKNRKTVILFTVITLPFFALRLLSDNVVTFNPVSERSTSYIYCNTFLEWQILLYLATTAYVTQHHKFSKNFRNLGQVAVTWFYGLLPFLFYDFTIGILVFIASPNLRPPTKLLFAGFSCLIAYMYMLHVSVWLLSMVITISEENSHGKKAISIALKLCRRNKFHGFILMACLSTLSLTVIALLGFMVSISEQNKVIWYMSTVMVASLVCPLMLLMFELSVVFYDEDSRNDYGGSLLSNLLI